MLAILSHTCWHAISRPTPSIAIIPLPLLIPSPLASPSLSFLPSAASTATAAQVTEVRSASASLAQQLSSKPLSELRAMARERGLQGNTKAELLKLL